MGGQDPGVGSGCARGGMSVQRGGRNTAPPPPPRVLGSPLTFLLPQRALGSFVFLLFGGFLGIFALFTFLRVPETRGRPFTPGGGPALPPPRPPRLLQPPEKACTELQCLAGGEET